MEKSTLKKLKHSLPKDYVERINKEIKEEGGEPLSSQYINRVMNPENKATSLTVLKLAVKVAKDYKKELQDIANEIKSI